MKKLLLLLALFCFGGNLTAEASHAMGGEIYVTHVSGSQYRFQFRFWRFMGGISAPPFISASVKGLIFNSPEVSFNLNLDSSKVISPNYAEEYFYSSLHSFIDLNDEYLIKVFTCCRNANILNLGGPSSGSLTFTVAAQFLPSFQNSPNSSPRFLLAPDPFALLNQPYVHGPFAFDPDGDSLTFRMDTTKTLLSANLSVVQPFIYLYQVNNSSYSFDSQTGTFSWLPNTLGAYQLTYTVDEWRNGQKIGSVTRDVQISVVNNSFNTTPPSIFLGGNQLSGFSLPQMNAYAGSVFNLTIAINDPDPTSKSFRFTGPIFQGSNPAMVTTTNTSVGISASINWTPNASMVSSTPHMMHIRYLEATPLYTFSRDIPVMVTVLPAVAGLDGLESNSKNVYAFINEAGQVQLNFTLSETSDLSIYAYDVQGRKLGVIVEGRFEPGQHQSVNHELAGYQGVMILRAQDRQVWQQTIKLIVR